MKYPAELVWSAACAAYRVNHGYVKTVEHDEQGTVIKDTNRNIMLGILDNPDCIAEEDQTLAQECKRVLTNAVTLQALKGELNDWSQVITTVSKKTEITKPYDLSVIASMPASYFQTLRRESVQSRLACAEDSHVGKIGEKVQLTIEVLRSSYSVKFNTWYITGINSENFAVFFSYREQLEIGVTVTVSGTVKRHADRATQLTRVKLVNKE
jgi:hypothetical protein